MRIMLILLAAIWPFAPGAPVQDAVVMLETRRSNEIIAWQQTGENGKITFNHLDAGSYNLLLQFPQLEGKWIKQKGRQRVLTKATYNQKNKTYYYQGDEGYFSMKFSKIKKINSEAFKTVFQELRTDEGFRHLVAHFKTDKNGAGISVSVKKLTAGQFKRQTEKTEHDISMISIPSQR